MRQQLSGLQIYLAAVGGTLHRQTVLITHHAPSASSIHPRFAGDAWNVCFTRDMEDLMGDGVDLWIHGLTHNSFDYRIKGSNPRGYAMDDG